MAQLFFDPKKVIGYHRSTASKLSAKGLRFKMWGQCAVRISGETPVTVMEYNGYYDIAFYPGMSLPGLVEYIRAHQKDGAGLPVEYKANAIYIQVDVGSIDEFEFAWEAIDTILQKLQSF